MANNQQPSQPTSDTTQLRKRLVDYLHHCFYRQVLHAADTFCFERLLARALYYLLEYPSEKIEDIAWNFLDAYDRKDMSPPDDDDPEWFRVAAAEQNMLDLLESMLGEEDIPNKFRTLSAASLITIRCLPGKQYPWSINELWMKLRELKESVGHDVADLARSINWGILEVDRDKGTILDRLHAILDGTRPEEGSNSPDEMSIPDRYVFRKADDLWEVAFKDEGPRPIRDLMGKKYIHYLISHQGQDVKIVELVQAFQKVPKEVSKHFAAMEEKLGQGAKDDLVMTEVDRAEYKEQLSKLSQDIKRAKKENLPDRALRLEKQKADIEIYLHEGLTNSGRIRKLGSTAQRFLKSAYKCVKTAKEEIRKKRLLHLYQHLSFIRIGYTCISTCLK